MIGELRYFLGLQIYQAKKRTFSNQAKYFKEILKWFSLEQSKVIETPMTAFCNLDKNKNRKKVEEIKY